MLGKILACQFAREHKVCSTLFYASLFLCFFFLVLVRLLVLLHFHLHLIHFPLHLHLHLPFFRLSLRLSVRLPFDWLMIDFDGVEHTTAPTKFSSAREHTACIN
jgi:hypothetical protein